MSVRERRLRECYDSALFGIEQAIDALDKAGSTLLKGSAEHLHQNVLTLRKTMFYPYPGDTNDKRSHESWNSWIPASNPPAKGKRVLVMLTTGEVWAGHYDGENWNVHVMDVCNSITHWMPIPKLPKDEL